MKHSKTTATAALTTALAATLSCTGAIGNGGGPGAAGAGAGPATSGGVGPGARNGGSGPAGPSTAQGSCADASLPPVRAWKLDGTQYLASVRSVVGAGQIVGNIPPDPITAGFDTSDTNEVTPLHADAYAAYAESAAALAVPTVGTNFPCLIRGSNPDDACVNGFISAVVRKAYRRPIDASEATRYLAFFRKAQASGSVTEAARLVYEATLQSPYFLFRWETGPQGQRGRVALTPHELAAELAYLLTDAPPDAELAKAADDGTIAQPEVRMALARRLLDQPAAHGKLQRFFDAQLRLSDLRDGTITKDAKLFPKFAAVQQDMVAETTTFLEKEIWDSASTFQRLFSAPYSYVTPALADVYDIAKPAGAGPVKVDLDPQRRGGLLSQPAVLAAFSSTGGTSPVHRGLLFYRTLLCEEPPPPLPNAETMKNGRLVSPDPNATQREHWEFAQKTPAAAVCVGCHRAFQPLGLGLERYDAAGRFRATEYGKTIDPSGAISGFGDDLDGPFADGLELGRRIAASNAGQTCFVRQYTRFALGRDLDSQDLSCSTAQTVARFRQASLSVPELLVALSLSDAFSYRTAEAP